MQRAVLSVSASLINSPFQVEVFWVVAHSDVSFSSLTAVKASKLEPTLDVLNFVFRSIIQCSFRYYTAIRSADVMHPFVSAVLHICSICSTRSRRTVRKLLDIPS